MTVEASETSPAAVLKPRPLNAAALRCRLRSMSRAEVVLLMFICFKHLDPDWDEIGDFIEKCIPGEFHADFARDFAERQSMEIP